MQPLTLEQTITQYRDRQQLPSRQSIIRQGNLYFAPTKDGTAVDPFMYLPTEEGIFSQNEGISYNKVYVERALQNSQSNFLQKYLLQS